MEVAANGSAPPWCRKATLSVGAAAALGFVAHRLLKRRRRGSDKAAVLAVVASGDAVGGAAARAAALGEMAVVSPSELGQAAGGRHTVAIFCSDASKYLELDMAFLQQCLEKLVPGGRVTARLGGLTEEEANRLETTGLFAGALEPTVVHHAAHNLAVEFSCEKPSWSSGAATELPGAVKRIDEDELLGEVPQPVGKGKSDCSSAPKACANCSCGRKELEEKVGAAEAKKRLEQGKERSACGSCYLGDAFRCETCPYKGLPAFKPGTKVELSSGETEGSVLLGFAAGEGSTETTNGKLLISSA